MDFLLNAEPLLRTFWYISIPVSLIFIVQTILTFTGADASDGIGADFDGDLNGGDAPFQLFSFRNLINFLLGFGWSGVSFYNLIPSKLLLIIVAVVVGCAFVLLFFVIIRQLMRLAEDDTFKLDKTLNKTAEVYLTIPGKKDGTGKVLLSVGGAMHELDAMTEADTISSGKMVKVIRIENNQILIVEKI